MCTYCNCTVLICTSGNHGNSGFVAHLSKGVEALLPESRSCRRTSDMGVRGTMVTFWCVQKKRKEVGEECVNKYYGTLATYTHVHHYAPQLVVVISKDKRDDTSKLEWLVIQNVFTCASKQNQSTLAPIYQQQAWNATSDQTASTTTFSQTPPTIRLYPNTLSTTRDNTIVFSVNKQPKKNSLTLTDEVLASFISTLLLSRMSSSVRNYSNQRIKIS